MAMLFDNVKQIGGNTMKKLFYFVLLFIFLSAIANGQDESSLKPYLNSDDLSKLSKADQIAAEADRQMSVVKNLNNKIQSMQKESSQITKKAKHEIRLLQSEAWEKHVQASANYEKSNEIKYGIYKKYLNHFWKEHEGQEANFINAKMLEEQARDNFSQASVYRRNTRHMNLGSVKVEKLTEANNLEAAAIRRQVSSLSACLGAAATSASAVRPDSVSLPDTTHPAVAVVTPAPAAVTQPPVSTPPAVVAVPVIVSPPAISVEKTEINPAARDSSFNNQVLFRIQIAANKAPFTFADLKKICPANYPVEMVSEAGWYKYQFIGVPLFSDASRILKEAAVKDAFVVAYRKTSKQNISEAIKNSRELEKRIQSEGRQGLISEIQYHVELATTKSFLKPEEVAKLYDGPEPVLVIMENGLYAYHLNAGYSLQEALDLKQRTALKTATIVAYKNAKKAVAGGTL
jgi:hypothetical protein